MQRLKIPSNVQEFSQHQHWGKTTRMNVEMENSLSSSSSSLKTFSALLVKIIFAKRIFQSSKNVKN